MKDFKVVFTIVHAKNCPLYENGELLHLSEKTLSCPVGKEVCLILVRDMTQILFSFLRELRKETQDLEGTEYNCSGCSGLIKFAVTAPKENAADNDAGKTVAPIEEATRKFHADVLTHCFDNILTSEQIRLCAGQFRDVHLEAGSTLIQQGKQNHNIYIILEGELVLEDNGFFIESLKEYELCGEMSYLGADIAVSTVRAVGPAKVMAIEGARFSSLLEGLPEIQVFMAQLLSRRLLRTNEARNRDVEACMTGRVDKIVPAELFQIFHMHQKTGVLSLDMPAGTGKVSFREGCLINARYNDLQNEEAIFKILAERSGWYRFTTGLSPEEMKAAEIGNFMALLMEGVKRVDESPSPRVKISERH
jgi:CRP/FNR family cyclic AMP-dependent transcriptional regulator